MDFFLIKVGIIHRGLTLDGWQTMTLHWKNIFKPINGKHPKWCLLNDKEARSACWGFLSRSAESLYLGMEDKQAGLLGTRFQRNGFMEIRVKGSVVRPPISSSWHVDPPPTWSCVIWEGVTVHPNHSRDMTSCRLPLVVKYLCQHHRFALMAVRSLTRAFSFFYLSSLPFPSDFNWIWTN